jgi:hypothetical protein
MAVKEEEKVKPEEVDDGKDEMAALDALEKEATEFNKVGLHPVRPRKALLRSFLGCGDRSYTQSL